MQTKAGGEFCSTLGETAERLLTGCPINAHTWPELLRMILLARSVAQAPNKALTSSHPIPHPTPHTTPLLTPPLTSAHPYPTLTPPSHHPDLIRPVPQAPKKRAVALTAMLGHGAGNALIAAAASAALGGGHAVSVRWRIRRM